MIRRPPRSTPRRSSAASDVYKRQCQEWEEASKWDSSSLFISYSGAAPIECLCELSPPPQQNTFFPSGIWSKDDKKHWMVEESYVFEYSCAEGRREGGRGEGAWESLGKQCSIIPTQSQAVLKKLPASPSVPWRHEDNARPVLFRWHKTPTPTPHFHLDPQAWPSSPAQHQQHELITLTLSLPQVNPLDHSTFILVAKWPTCPGPHQ